MWPGALALVGDTWRAPRTERPSIDNRPQHVPNVPRPEPSELTVEVASGARPAGLQSDWEDLLARADIANAFMNPALVRLASQFYPTRNCFALLAWRKDAPRPRLVGVWAFTRRRQSVVLSAPPTPHAYLSDPVIDRSCLDSVLEAMLAHICGDATLPKIVSLETMGMDTATMAALSRVLAARCSPSRIFAAWSRPKLASDLDGASYMGRALSGSSRKKLRQHRRRLADGGALRFSMASEAEEVRQTFKGFLTLEAAGWKGRGHTALLSRTSDANFARAMIAALAAEGRAHIYALTLETKPVSMQIVLRAGNTAFTWKTVYDERFRDFSPGMLLLEDCTAALLADEGIAHVDSAPLTTAVTCLCGGRGPRSGGFGSTCGRADHGSSPCSVAFRR